MNDSSFGAKALTHKVYLPPQYLLDLFVSLTHLFLQVFATDGDADLVRLLKKNLKHNNGNCKSVKQFQALVPNC